MAKLEHPAALIIMDGFGIDKASDINAISQAKTPILDKVFSENVTTKLQASGEAVGLPAGQMGNSEVGHLNIGAGRVVFQELTRINNACKNDELKDNQVLLKACQNAVESGGALHLMGLLSDGGVHSSIEHLYALIDLAIDMHVPTVLVHCLMDGRDVPPTSGVDYVAALQDYIDKANQRAAQLADASAANAAQADADDAAHAAGADGTNARAAGASAPTHIAIASIQGRYYAMDRDNRWERVQKGYQCLVNATPCDPSISGVELMRNSYANDITDEFVEPLAIVDRGMKDGDSVIFFNFRPDRAREITKAIAEPNFGGFETGKRPDVYYVCMTEYDATFTSPVAFPKTFPEHVLADVLADAGLVQLHTAETEKYAHVTFFLNGGREEPKANEKRVLVDSPKVATYDLQPEMSEPEVASGLAKAIQAGEADVYIVNFANCDMVGHTGVEEAAIKAVEAVDNGVGQVLEAIKAKGGFALITADHGNADKMKEADGSPHTAHTTAPVPFVLVDYTGQCRQLAKHEGALCDIAPTLLDLIGVPAPAEMTGKSLVA